MQDQQNLSISQQLKLSLQVGDHIDSRYLIEQEIGKGGMGVVYRAQDNLLSKAVAVKVMQIQQDDQVSQRFKLVPVHREFDRLARAVLASSPVAA